MTMVDGKSINVITHTASNQRCNLRGATKDFNKLLFKLTNYR